MEERWVFVPMLYRASTYSWGYDHRKLLMREQLIDQGINWKELLADDFVYIRQDGSEDG